MKQLSLFDAPKDDPSSTQIIVGFEAKIKTLEEECARLRAENNRAILTKQADDSAIIRQENIIEKLNEKIKKLETLIALDEAKINELFSIKVK
jgi:hypothetical protein